MVRGVFYALSIQVCLAAAARFHPLQFAAMNMNAFVGGEDTVHEHRSDFIVNDVRFSIRSNHRSLSSARGGSTQEKYPCNK
jgi:hypothetical protein